MKSVFVLVMGLILASCFTNAHDQSPAKILKKVTVCDKVQIPIYGMIERPASDGEVFSGLVLGGLIGNQFGSGKGNDAMTVIGALMGAESAGERKREKVIVDYRTTTQCWEEWQ